MKKAIIGWLCLGMLLTLLPVGSLAGGLVGDTALVNNLNPADRLHLRAQPNEKADSLGKYYNGTVVTILETLADPWVKVHIGDNQGGAEGYMNRKFLAMGSAMSKVKSAMPLYQSMSSAWELYDRPSTNAEFRMCGLEAGIQLMGFTPTWWHILLPKQGITGYISAKNGLAQNSGAVVNNPKATDRLNLRTKADKNAPTLGKYYTGVTVQVLAYVGDGSWAKVRIGNLEGFMDMQFLASSTQAKQIKSAIPTVKVKNAKPTQSLNQRAGQSTLSASLGQYKDGTKVQVLGVGSTWYHVKIGDKVGFMLAQYLTPKLPQ